MFVFGDFNIHHKHSLTYSDGTDRPGEPHNNISISNDLTQMINFLTLIFDCDSHNPPLLDLFISSDISNLQWLSLHLKVLIMLLSQFLLNIGNLMGCPVSLNSLWLVLCWLGWSSPSFERVMREDIFNFNASAASSEFCQWVQVRTDVYIPH